MGRPNALRGRAWSLAAAAVAAAALGVGVTYAAAGGSDGAGRGPGVSGGQPHHPLGVAGAWRQVWGDEFDGTSIDRRRWSTEDGQSMNYVTAHASNVRVADGCLVLTLSSSSSGAYVSSHPQDGTLLDGYELPPGGYVEARVLFPGDGAAIYNWPAWWVSGAVDWPRSGEHDIAEGLGALTVNYHSGSGPHNFGPVPGLWSNQFHVYGLYRAADHAEVYWDGRLVRSYPTDDTGAGESLIFNVGAGSPGHEPNGSVPAYGARSQLKVDYVRAFEPAAG